MIKIPVAISWYRYTSEQSQKNNNGAPVASRSIPIIQFVSQEEAQDPITFLVPIMMKEILWAH